MNNFGFALTNFDFLTVGVASSAIALLGFAVYFSDRKNSTGRSFLFFALMTILWSASNFIQYQFTTVEVTLLAMRADLFLATWHAFSFFQFSYVFPESKAQYPPWYRRILLPIVTVTSLITLTPLVFSGINHLAPYGHITNPSRGVGIILFVLVTLGLLVFGIVRIYIKARSTSGMVERRQILFVFFGLCVTAILIVILSMFLPIFLSNLTYLPLSALFFLPFIGLIFYSVQRFRLFNLKVVAVQLFTFTLSVLMFVEVLDTKDPLALLFRTSLLIAIIVAGILLTRSVTREVEQRELIEKQEKELEVANARLKELDQQKSEFLSFASHQLRTPLTAIKWNAGAVLDGTFGAISTELTEAVKTIFDESKLMALFINDYLNVSRIEQGKMEYRYVPTNLGEVVRTTAAQMEPTIKEKGLVLVTDISAETVMVWADASKVTQIISNLVDNAIKYTPKGTITVSMHKVVAEGKVRVEIKDTGIGMDKETLGKVFDKFTRGENAKEVNTAGSGLGLFIVKTFVEAHKGKIWIESEGVGKGSQFVVEFPLYVQPATPTPVTPPASA